jgi:hypothetical protein
MAHVEVHGGVRPQTIHHYRGQALPMFQGGVVRTEDGGDDDVIGTLDYYGPEACAEMIAKGILPLTDEERKTTSQNTIQRLLERVAEKL